MHRVAYALHCTALHVCAFACERKAISHFRLPLGFHYRMADLRSHLLAFRPFISLPLPLPRLFGPGSAPDGLVFVLSYLALFFPLFLPVVCWVTAQHQASFSPVLDLCSALYLYDHIDLPQMRQNQHQTFLRRVGLLPFFFVCLCAGVPRKRKKFATLLRVRIYPRFAARWSCTRFCSCSCLHGEDAAPSPVRR